MEKRLHWEEIMDRDDYMRKGLHKEVIMQGKNNIGEKII